MTLVRILSIPALALLSALSLAACSGDDGSASASDPAAPGAQADAPQPPTAVPAAPGRVRSTGLPTVMDTGGEGATAELCLGAIAESYPPQCSGPTIVNWDWAAQKGTFDQQDDVRWGTYAVTGTWDGTAFTVTDALTGALYDPMMPEPVVLPDPSVSYSAAELEGIARDLGDDLPGYQGSYADESGHVLVDVLYDDGNLQSYVDAAYGADVVVLDAALADVE